MDFRAKLLAAAGAALIFGATGAVRADDAPATKVPGSQGLISVDKNVTRDPDNRGLTNAQQRIEDNIQDRKDRKADKADRDDKTAHAKDKDKVRHDRDDKGMRAEKADRPAKADRPDRPDHPERAGRS